MQNIFCFILIFTCNLNKVLASDFFPLKSIVLLVTLSWTGLDKYLLFFASFSVLFTSTVYCYSQVCFSCWFSAITEQCDDKNNIKVASSLQFSIKVLQVHPIFIITKMFYFKYTKLLYIVLQWEKKSHKMCISNIQWGIQRFIAILKVCINCICIHVLLMIQELQMLYTWWEKMHKKEILTPAG